MFSAFVTMFAALDSLAQTEAPRPRANPFDRPDFIMNLGEATETEIVVRPTQLLLRATMVTSNSALANINGELLSVGQRIEGYRVSRITEGRVVLYDGGDQLVLDVYQSQRESEQERRDD